MRRVCYLVLLFVLAAGSAHAGSLGTTLVRTITNCTDSDPNTAVVAPTAAGVYVTPDRSPEFNQTSTNTYGLVYGYEHSNAARTITLPWWAYDATAAVWVALASDTAVPIRTLYAETTLGPLTLYPQIASCSIAIGTGVKIYAVAR
jgi:hypothetical protein